MNQRGFATLEVILMVMVIAILASIAVPRFNAVTAAANSAKIQSDLSTIDTAIAIYIMENGNPSTAPTMENLKSYLQDADNIKPPTGKCYTNESTDPVSVPEGNYTIKTTDDGDYRAALGGKTSGEFTRKASN